MKAKILLFSVALAATVFTSCSNEDTSLEADYQNDVINTTVENDDFLKLQENIIEYGTLRAEQNALALNGNVVSDNSKTRGFWGKLWGFAKGLFKSDAKGFGIKIDSGGTKAKMPKPRTRGGVGDAIITAVEGATGAAVLSSIGFVVDVFRGAQVYDATTGDFGAKKSIGIAASTPPVYSSDVALDSVIIFVPSEGKTEVTQLDSAGYYHNAAIIDIFKNIPNIETLAAMSDEELVQVVSRSVEHVFELPEGSFQCDVVRDTVSSVIDLEYKEEVASSEGTVQAEHEKVMSVIETYLQNMYETEGLEGDWKEYSKGVMNIINNSSLDSDTKENLRAVFSVAFASSQLWNIEMLKEIIDE